MPAKKSTSAKSTATKTASKAKAKTKNVAASKTKAGDKEVTIDRRKTADRRDESTETSDAQALDTELPQRREKVQRRRQIDPTTCERDYSVSEVEFMSAMDEYKRTSGRMFPTCSEVLEVVRNLGYVQLTPAELATVRPEEINPVDNHTDEANDFESADLEEAELAF